MFLKDMIMKKLSFVLMLLFFTTCKCLASGIGYINYEKIIENYPYAKTALQDIENKNEEIQNFIIEKEKEFAKLETAVQKKKFQDSVNVELKSREKAFNDFRAKKEDDVYNRIHAISEKIRLEKNLDAVIDARSIFSGGIDLTDIIIQKLSQPQYYENNKNYN